MENRCSSKRYAGWVAGCFLDGSRVASGWAGGVAGGQKWVAEAGRVAAACGWWEWGEGTQYHPPRPFNPPVLEGAVEPVPTPHLSFSAHRTPNDPHHTLTASDDGPAGECVRVDYLTRIRPHINAHAYIYTHPESARPFLYTCSTTQPSTAGAFSVVRETEGGGAKKTRRRDLLDPFSGDLLEGLETRFFVPQSASHHVQVVIFKTAQHT